MQNSNQNNDTQETVPIPNNWQQQNFTPNIQPIPQIQQFSQIPQLPQMPYLPQMLQMPQMTQMPLMQQTPQQIQPPSANVISPQIQFGQQIPNQTQPPGFQSSQKMDFQSTMMMNQNKFPQQQNPNVQQPFQNLQQFPPPNFNMISFPNQNPPNFQMSLNQQNEQKKIQELKNQIEELEQQLEKIELEKQAMKKKFDNENQALKQQLEELEQQVDDKEAELQQKESNYQNKLLKINSEHQEEISKLQQQLEDEQRNNLSLKRIIESKTKSDQEMLNQQNFLVQMDQNAIQAKRYKQEIEEKEVIMKELELKLESKEKSYQDLQFSSQQEQKALQKQISDVQQTVKNKDQEIICLKNLYSQKEEQLQSTINEFKFENDQLKIKLESSENQKNILQNQLNEANERIKKFSNSSNIDQNYKQMAEQYEYQQQQSQQQLRDIERNKLQQLDEMNKRRQAEKEKQHQKNQMGKEKFQKAIQSQGKIECCFLMDIYKMNEKIKKNVVKGLDQSIQQIKTITSRDLITASHCYGYMKKQQVQQTINFTQDSSLVINNLQKQKFEDYEDKPEDVKSALKQALNLNWTQQYKLVVLIPTSPCHGKKYHAPSKYIKWFFFTREYDTKPEDNIQDMIEQLIQKDIRLLIIRINKDTTIMCNEIDKIYKAKNKSYMFFTFKVENPEKSSSSEELQNNIRMSAGNIIGINNHTTFTVLNKQNRQENFQEGLDQKKLLKAEVYEQSKEAEQLLAENKSKFENAKDDLPNVSSEKAKQDQIQFEKDVERIQNQDGALQALCKKGDLSNFETRVNCVQFQCNVYTVDLIEKQFEKKKEDIHSINYENNDFEVKHENQWQCIRTEKPFAFGMVKQVYIMKKQGAQNEIYVVKIPINTGCYQSMAAAVNDCRSHLIAKSFMKQFINRLSEVNQKIPKVQYTDFLLLEESPNKIWLAERFFKGEFKKYNNNFGFILDQQSPLNELAQAYSYYTYQESSYSYIVNDIQGIDNYFTDPAINTTQGGFDETDAGEEGITNYLGSLEVKKNLCQNLLRSINIEID